MEPDSQPSQPTPLTQAERRFLLRRARDAIAAALCSKPLPPADDPTPSLLTPAGVFVSLHRFRELRGCVGTLTADRPLHETVEHIAVAAALDDPRFPPLSEAELADTEIEISRLGPLVPTRAEDVAVGRDGVCVARGEARGVLLPQVAGHYGWDRERLLDEVCRKAYLPSDTWRKPGCELFRFIAEIFGDGDERAG
jgi:AmmeMemoRadiSam system protein A